eukprot:PLAT11276.1.p1 GENE.PLAT11276.1~~PLAT11276.1.p1  ORF type:complete len:347 (+),score=60.53 PLAT11276.1:342-1382(+)
MADALPSKQRAEMLLALQYMRGVTSLNVRGLRLKVKDASRLRAAMRKWPPMQVLKLHWQPPRLTDVILRQLAETTALRVLELPSCGLDASTADALAAALSGCSKLHTLSLYDNAIDADGAALLADALATCVSLQDLNLNACPVQWGLTQLAEGLQDCRGLRVLQLSKCGLRPNDIKMFAWVLPRFALQTLDFSYNALVARRSEDGSHLDGLRALMEALAVCEPQLAELKLNHCKLGRDGQQACNLLRIGCTELQWLSLRGNYLDDDGGAALADSLTDMRRLRQLVLLNNALQRSSLQLTRAALQLPLMAALDLRHNYIESEAELSAELQAVATGADWVRWKVSVDE